jgi:ABC-type glycerol-3-phosphate transport system permease component
MAGVILIILPAVPVFVLGYRHVVRGLTAGAVKG